MGLRPLPRIPTSSSILSLPPHPPPWPSFKVLWRGMGGQRRPIDWVVKGLAVSCPFPKNCNCNDGKGAMVSWTMRPIYSLAALHACNCMQQARSGKASKAKPTKSRTNQNRKGRTKGQRPRGVFRVWVPGWHTHIQHSPSATTEKP